MRLSVNLDDDLYAFTKSLAKAEDVSVSIAVNRLLRRALEPRKAVANRRHPASGLPVSLGRAAFTSEDVKRLEEAEDLRHLR